MKICSICEMPCKRYEKDHFPMQKRLNGKETWILCLNCHDLKDRVTFSEWNAEDLWHEMQSLFQKSTPIQRVILCKMFYLTSDATDVLKIEQQEKTAT